MIKQLLIAWTTIFVLINLTYLLSRKINNISILDIVWGFSFGALSIFFAFTGEGNAFRQWTLAVLTSLWSGRLGFYLAGRWMRYNGSEDPRYIELKKKWGNEKNLKILVFFYFQGLLIMLFSVIFAVPTWNKNDQIATLEIVGLGIVIIALAGQCGAAWQLSSFKKNVGSKEVCELGLWHYCRHPNYFFEWIIWIGFYLIATSSGAWWSIYCPASMLFLLLKVTGVPPSEAQSLKSKGANYNRYQKTTSCFIPFPRKKIKT